MWFESLGNWRGDGFVFAWILSTLGLAIVALLAPLLLGMFAGLFFFKEDNPGKDTSKNDPATDLDAVMRVEPDLTLADWDADLANIRLIEERGKSG